jgi:hypothetical protein
MNRRTVLKNLAILAGGAAILPSCLKKPNDDTLTLKKIKLSDDQQKLVGDVCETIIPTTNTPGAKDIRVHLFVLKMLDDCYTKKDQEKFVAGLAEFDDMIKKKYGNAFADLSPQQRETCLTQLEKSTIPVITTTKVIKPVGEGQKSIEPPKKKPDVPPLAFCYQAIKQQTIFGYTNSQYFMTKQIVYELVPGRYNAHFPAKNLKNA